MAIRRILPRPNLRPSGKLYKKARRAGIVLALGENRVSFACGVRRAREGAMDIADRLRGLGLSQYEAVFRGNAIHPDTLPELSEADIEKLGVLLGHRKTMLCAAAGMPAKAELAREEAAERRQLTVMLCDLVCSTALSRRLDPQELRNGRPKSAAILAA